MKTASQLDYTKRIERVIAAVAVALEKDRELPSVATLAEIAHFSPFHFMRVYRALAGESLGTTVQRLRLARAAHLLVSSAEPISEIAGRVGGERGGSETPLADGRGGSSVPYAKVAVGRSGRSHLSFRCASGRICLSACGGRRRAWSGDSRDSVVMC